jgi:pilus assembly protein FimV
MLASLDDDDDMSEVDLDTSLLDATGQTQVLSDDMTVDDVGTLRDDAETLLASLDDDDDGDFDFAKTEALPKDVYDADMSADDTGRMPGLAGSTDLDLDLDDLTAALKISEVGDTMNQGRDDPTVEQPKIRRGGSADDGSRTSITQALDPEDLSSELHEARTMTEVGTKLDLARAYVDMGDPSGARSILEEVLDEGDNAQKQQAQKLLDSLPS